MINQTVAQKLEKIVKQDLQIVVQNTIFRDADGYQLFDQYQIRFSEHGVTVWAHQEQIQWFSSLKSAVSWCIANKYKQYNLARDIEMSDSDSSRIGNDVEVIQEILPTIRDRERRSVVRDKLQTKQTQLKQAQQRLMKCVNLAKYFQIRGFNDEIARTRRSAPNTTNRPSVGKSGSKN